MNKPEWLNKTNIGWGVSILIISYFMSWGAYQLDKSIKEEDARIKVIDDAIPIEGLDCVHTASQGGTSASWRYDCSGVVDYDIRKLEVTVAMINGTYKVVHTYELKSDYTDWCDYWSTCG